MNISCGWSSQDAVGLGESWRDSHCSQDASAPVGISAAKQRKRWGEVLTVPSGPRALPSRQPSGVLSSCLCRENFSGPHLPAGVEGRLVWAKLLQISVVTGGWALPLTKEGVSEWRAVTSSQPQASGLYFHELSLASLPNPYFNRSTSSQKEKLHYIWILQYIPPYSAFCYDQS